MKMFIQIPYTYSQNKAHSRNNRSSHFALKATANQKLYKKL